jgi:hypothetical protein
MGDRLYKNITHGSLDLGFSGIAMGFGSQFILGFTNYQLPITNDQLPITFD